MKDGAESFESSPKKSSKLSDHESMSDARKKTGQFFVGCHVSAKGGVDNAVKMAAEMSARAFSFFVRPQRTWKAKPMDPLVAESFRTLCKEHGYSPHLILPHGSYLGNLGSSEADQRNKSLQLLVDELNRCSMLGLVQFNIHPGSSCGKITQQESIKYIAQGINQALEQTSGVKIVLENMCGQGSTVGGDLAEIRQILDLVADRTRVGVCLDTCHAMAAGYDLSKQEGFDQLIEDFQSKIGFEWLAGVHLNDSKAPAGSHLDRHEHIGRGKIGLEGFKRIMTCPHFADIPLILETPWTDEGGVQQREIQLLTDMAGQKR